MVLLLLKNQEVVIRKKLKIPNECEASLFGFVDDLRSWHKLLRFMRGVWAVGRIVDNCNAGMLLERRRQLAVEVNPLPDMVSGIAEERQINGIRG